MGQSLEEYIKDVFAGTVNEEDENKRLKKLNEYFSYLGNANNPPDSILKNGDAIEVKKIETRGSALALNSSYPNSKLYSNSPMITEACRTCEVWTEKDLVYTVGVLKDNKLSELCMVYGMDYAADNEVYERIKKVIKDGVNTIEDVEFSETRELGRVNKIDPLGITYLRVRGMWHIQNPFRVFEYVYKPDDKKKFNFMALINDEKYESLKYTQELEDLSNRKENLNIRDVEIKNPDNPAELVNAKLITYKN